MKLLFDQNISFRVINKLSDFFPGSKQVRELGLEDCGDMEIWTYAKVHGFSIVSFDADFADIANINGSPPKIVWLRTGNLTTKNVAQILQHHRDTNIEFLSSEQMINIDCPEIGSQAAD